MGLRAKALFATIAYVIIVPPLLAQGSMSQGLFGTKEEYRVLQGDRYSFNFKSAPVDGVLRTLASLAGINIIVPPTVDGDVDLQLSSVQAIDVLDAVANLRSLGYEIENGILRVGSAAEFEKNEVVLTTDSVRLKYALAKDIVTSLGTFVSEDGAVMADERTNSVIMRDTVAAIAEMRSVLQELDTSDRQVLIEGRIAEVARDWGREIGVQWGGTANTSSVDVTGLTSIGVSEVPRAEGVEANNLFATLPAGRPNSGVGIVFGMLGDSLDIDLALAAAENSGQVDIISEPSIVTSSGISASISSGESFNVKTEGGQATGGSVQSISTGVNLEVTPTIAEEDLIKLQIDVSTSSPDFSRAVDGIPSILNNAATTTVVVRNGQSTVIGGLAKFTGRNVRNRVPGLGHLPLLGYMFRSKRRTKTNSELMVFIRPRLLTSEVVPPQMSKYSRTERVKTDQTIKDLYEEDKREKGRVKGFLKKVRKLKPSKSSRSGGSKYRSRFAR